VKPEDLHGQAQQAYETWTLLGMSPAQAMREVVAMGLVEPGPGDVSATGESRRTPRAGVEAEPGSGGEVALPRARRGRSGAHSAWSWEASGEPAALVPSAETSETGETAEREIDRQLRMAYDQAMRAAQRGGLSAERADILVRRTMTEACHAVVTETAKWNR
jgi:hypothetical protein